MDYKRKEIRVGDKVYIKDSDSLNPEKISFIVKEITAVDGIPFIHGKYGGFPDTAIETEI